METAEQRNMDIINARRAVLEAKKHLEECERRLDEVCGLVPEAMQRKPSKKTLSRAEFSRACGL